MIFNLISKLITRHLSTFTCEEYNFISESEVRMRMILFLLNLILTLTECRLETLQNSKNHYVDFKSNKYV